MLVGNDAQRNPTTAPNGESPLVHIILYIITYFKDKTQKRDKAGLRNMGSNPMVINIALSVVCSNVEQQTSNLKFYSFSKVYNLVFV